MIEDFDDFPIRVVPGERNIFFELSAYEESVPDPAPCVVIPVTDYMRLEDERKRLAREAAIRSTWSPPIPEKRTPAKKKAEPVRSRIKDLPTYERHRFHAQRVARCGGCGHAITRCHCAEMRKACNKCSRPIGYKNVTGLCRYCSAGANSIASQGKRSITMKAKKLHTQGSSMEQEQAQNLVGV